MIDSQWIAEQQRLAAEVIKATTQARQYTPTLAQKMILLDKLKAARQALHQHRSAVNERAAA